jgi:uncharacterized protein
MMSSRRYVPWFLAAFVAISSQAAPRAETALPRPTELVTDRAGVLSDTEIETLTKDLQELEQSGLAQAIIYVDSSLPPGAVLEELTLQSVNAWGVGRKGADDGVAIFIFVKDRRMRIEVGRGLENAISDDDAKSIIDEQLRPALRQGRFADGLTQTIGRIRDLLSTKAGGSNPVVYAESEVVRRKRTTARRCACDPRG